MQTAHATWPSSDWIAAAYVGDRDASLTAHNAGLIYEGALPSFRDEESRDRVLAHYEQASLEPVQTILDVRRIEDRLRPPRWLALTDELQEKWTYGRHFRMLPLAPTAVFIPLLSDEDADDIVLARRAAQEEAARSVAEHGVAAAEEEGPPTRREPRARAAKSRTTQAGEQFRGSRESAKFEQMLKTIGKTPAPEVRDVDPAKMARDMERLIDIVAKAQYLVIYTGAGISTAAKIPDYRGPEGVWTKMASGKSQPSAPMQFDMATPTSAHMIIAKLTSLGIVKHVVSTNVDGLHRRSGVPADKLSEVHGSNYVEYCSVCKREYRRPYDVANERNKRAESVPESLAGFARHETGRKCDACGGPLLDSVVNYDENLPAAVYETAVAESARADVALVLGTSLVVAPACDLPIRIKRRRAPNKNGYLVIVNLQKTPFDKKADVRIYRPVDEVMLGLIDGLRRRLPQLDLSIPKPPGLSEWLS